MARSLQLGGVMLQNPTLHLARSVSVIDVADVSRRAVTQFLAMPADKRALSEWLVGIYAQATSFAPRRPHTRPSGAPPSSRPGAPGSVSPPERIEDLVATVKSEAHATIAAALEGGPDALVRRLPTVVHILRVEDAFGGRGFAPVDAPRIKLNDRVLSLLVADFLTRPDDFARAMAAAPRPRITRSGISVRARPEDATEGRRDKDTG